MQNTKQLFGADGIRGNIDQYPFRQEDLIKLSQALAKWWLNKRIHQPVVLLSMDTRESSQRIKFILDEGFRRAGVEIRDAGILPTAAISFLVARNPELTGGVSITASHSLLWESGIKVFDQKGVKLSDSDEREIENFFHSDAHETGNQNHISKVHSETDYLQQYIQGMVNEFSAVNWRKDRILVDCANGATYQSAGPIFNTLGIPHLLRNVVPNGTNTNISSGSEHVRTYPLEFAKEIQTSGAHLGMALDGDADRVVFVDKQGLFYDGDMLLAILAIFLDEKKLLKNKRVVITQMSNSGLIEHLGNHGIQTQQVNNGDKHITDVLLKDDLTLGGEQIGHIIVRNNDFRITGDGLYTGLWILKALSQVSNPTLHDLLHGLRKWPQINASVMLGGRIHSKSEKIPGLAELREQVRNEFPDLSRFECRPASTEPVYRIMLESRDIQVPVLVEQALRLARHVQSHYDRLGEPIEILDCVTGGRISPNASSGFPG